MTRLPLLLVGCIVLPFACDSVPTPRELSDLKPDNGVEVDAPPEEDRGPPRDAEDDKGPSAPFQSSEWITDARPHPSGHKH